MKKATKFLVTLTASGAGGTKVGRVTVEVMAAAVSSLTSLGYGSCALSTTDAVYCWGDGRWGQLGNGQFYLGKPDGSATPVQVEGVGGIGTLTGVTSLTGSPDGNVCAILVSSEVDCWGWGFDGELGDGVFYTSTGGSATPVQVVGVGDSGTLTGVESLTGDGEAGNFCALLDSGGVDCWGVSENGELGNGTLSDSAVPVQVEGVGGVGTLSGVASLVGNEGTYCAVLGSGGVDCWGWGEQGELGNGAFYPTSPYGSAIPVQVEGVGGTGTLTGVASLASTGGSFCALLASGGADCWGLGGLGNEVANGSQAFYESATPLQVEGVGATGTLTGVDSIVGGVGTYCAVLDSADVDCWGGSDVGELGNGASYTNGAPIQVGAVGGTGTLTGVSSLADGTQTMCAVLDSGGVDCWGLGENGELGNGKTYPNAIFGSDTPVQVKGVGGTGTLTGVSSLSLDELSVCAVLDLGQVACWGVGEDGELGNGAFSQRATPVAVPSL